MATIHTDIARTPDDAMIRSWIASLELKGLEFEERWTCGYMSAQDLEDYEIESEEYARYKAAWLALKALLSGE